MAEIYLGDGLYATYQEGSAYITLYTWNGIEVTNTIFLEPETSEALLNLLTGAKRALKERMQNETGKAVAPEGRAT